MSDQHRLKDKVAIITGGGKGIGRAIGLAFASEGADVVIAARTKSDVDKVCQEIRQFGGAVLPVVADITSEHDVIQMVNKTIETYRKIDILVNNAGVPGPLGLVTGISKVQWDEVIAINLTGMFLCSKEVLKYMIERKNGNIINISSGAGTKVGFVRSLPYNVSKFGVEGFTYALAVQMKPYGICVNALRPGRMDTDFHKNSPPEFRRAMRKAEDVTRLAVFLALQTADTMAGESVDLAEWEKGK